MMRRLNFDVRHALRSADLAARLERVMRDVEHSSDGASVLALASDMDILMESSTDSPVIRNWRITSGLLRALAVDLSIKTAARVGGADVAADRGRLQVLLQAVDEIIGELDEEQLRTLLRGTYDARVPQVNKKVLVPTLLGLPLPTLYLAEKQNRSPRNYTARSDSPNVPKIPVLRITAYLDSKLVATTQQLQPHRLHSLRFLVRGNGWPEQAQRLGLELLSTYPPSLFHVSALETADRSGAPEFEATVTGNIQLNAAQSEGASDVAVTVRAAFTMADGSVHKASIVGHSQFHFRASSLGESITATASASMESVTGALPAGLFAGLQTALLAAYTRESLRRMLRIKFDIRLDHIAGNGTFTDTVFDVIEWAEREGRAEAFVREATAFVPENEGLQSFARSFESIKSCH